ncbi:hypothetical protein ACVNP0_11380 [Staphylococcus aureus]
MIVDERYQNSKCQDFLDFARRILESQNEKVTLKH